MMEGLSGRRTMMITKVLNSSFEMELRSLLLLAVSEKMEYTIDKIVAIDFISCYSSDFGFPFSNLHGQNDFKFGEISNRRMLVREAIKALVIKGLVSVEVNRCYLFSITELGKMYAEKLNSDYAKEYKAIAKITVEKYRKVSDEGVLAEIQAYSIRSLKG